jgi:hypothetical protein
MARPADRPHRDTAVFPRRSAREDKAVVQNRRRCPRLFSNSRSPEKQTLEPEIEFEKTLSGFASAKNNTSPEEEKKIAEAIKQSTLRRRN